MGAKGRFLPGSPGGPGRKARKPISFSDIEQNLQDDLKSTDAKIRHNATKLLLLLKKAQLSIDDSDKPSMLDPRIQRIVNHALGDLLNAPDVQEVVDE